MKHTQAGGEMTIDELRAILAAFDRAADKLPERSGAEDGLTLFRQAARELYDFDELSAFDYIFTGFYMGYTQRAKK